MTDKLFRTEAITEQKDKLYGEVVIAQPPSIYRVTFGILLMVIAVVLLLIYGTYARRETVVGYIVPDKGLVKIYAPLQGELFKQYVNEGSFVKKGDTLFAIRTLSSNSSGTDRDALLISQLNQQKESLDEKIRQETSLNDSQVEAIKTQILGLQNELKQSIEGLDLQNKQLAIATENKAKIVKLKKKGHVSQSRISESEQQLLSTQISLQNSKRQITQLRYRLADSNQQLQQLPIQWKSRQTDLKRNLSEIEQRLVEASGRREYAIRAPISGKLTALQISVGQTVNPQAPLVAILPEGTELHAELFLPTRAAGFIANGQNVLLRYGAFPYQHYGLHQGQVENVAQVILAPNELPIPVQLNEPVYRVKVALDNQTVLAFDKQFPLQAGMLLDADIVLEKRTLGQWLLEPIYGLRGKL